jgi:GT2 family glycosyltransferase
MEETPVPLRTSVLIVSYNMAEALRRCLTALDQSTGRESFEIIVVDNGSADGSLAVIDSFPKVTTLRLPRNFGFVKALNIGMRTAKAEFFLFLNPKTEVLPDTVAALTALLDQAPDAVAVSPALTTPDGQPAGILYKLPGSANLRAVAAAGAFEAAPVPKGGAETVPVEFAGFAALLVRGYFLKGLRHIDERYAHSWADAEVAIQIRRAGKKTLFAPGVHAIWHPEDSLTRTMPAPVLDLLAADWTLDAATYGSKHFGFMAGLKVRLLGALSALFSARLRLFSYLAGGQKIDGTQTTM